MRLLITGATGFIGAQLVRAARSIGHDVVATGSLNSELEQQRANRLAAEGISIVAGSLRVPTFAKRLVHGCEAVVHLASARRAGDVPDSYFFDVNVEATQLLLESCVRARVRRFVYGSSVAVYGSRGRAAVSEDTPVAPDDVHGESKVAAERVVRSFSDRLETTIARIGEAYGPEDLRLLKFFKAARRTPALIVGDSRSLHQPIHVQDLVRALLLAVEHPAASGETFVFAGPSAITSRDVLRTISATMAAPVWHLRLPFSRKSVSFRTDKARALLGFEPTISFGDGVRDTFNWYCSAGYLQSPLSHIKRPRAA